MTIKIPDLFLDAQLIRSNIINNKITASLALTRIEAILLSLPPTTDTTPLSEIKMREFIYKTHSIALENCHKEIKLNKSKNNSLNNLPS